MRPRMHTPLPTRLPVPGKRARCNSREKSRDRLSSTTKRRCLAHLQSNGNLCEQCNNIPWNVVDDWISYDGRFDWLGKPVAYVGKYYRRVSPSTTCPLCRQLRAPWIEAFVRDRDLTAHDHGDRIHIFRHLRHLPHVNDFPTARNVLRKYNAPYHIAVVPVGRDWKDHLKAHIATKGMVVVMPREEAESEIFVPQQVF